MLVRKVRFLLKHLGVPYDGSKLTKALRQTVASNTSIVLLACLNPNEANFEVFYISLMKLGFVDHSYTFGKV